MKSKKGFLYIRQVYYYIAFSIILLIGVLLASHHLFSLNDNILRRESTYLRSDFDIQINAPSKEQINQFEQNPLISSVLPMTILPVGVEGGSSLKLLMVESFKNVEIGFFNEDTLVSGSLDPNGLSIDEHAARKLNVSVGDSINVNYRNSRFSLIVTGIFLNVNYPSLNEGIGLMIWDDAWENAVPHTIRYDIAFISTDDVNNVLNTVLQNYLPLGSLMSQEEFIHRLEENTTKPSELSDEEWEIQLVNAYNNYEANFYNSNHNSIFIKDDISFTSLTIAQNMRDQQFQLSLRYSIGFGLAYFIFFLILFLRHVKTYNLLDVKYFTARHVRVRLVFELAIISTINLVILYFSVALLQHSFLASSQLMTLTWRIIISLVLFSLLLLVVVASMIKSPSAKSS